jgi:glycosyltransferase involved in cell wall biosynthesis
LKIILIGNYAEFLLGFRGVLLSDFVNAGHEVVVCVPGADPGIVDQLRAMGVEYCPIELERTGMNPYKDLKFLFQLKSHFTRIRPNFVLSYTIKPVIYGSLAASLCGIKQIYSIITGLGYAFVGNTWKQNVLNITVRFLYRLSLRANSAVFFQNADDLAFFSDLGLVSLKNQAVLINGSGVDLDYYEQMPFVSSAPIFLLIARLLNDKGILEYVEAAKILKKKYPQAVFRLVGPFYDNPAAINKSTVETWQQTGVIEYMGETKDVRPYISNANVYVLPSYREGTPRTVLEAMAMGRPIVTTNAPGCRETVIEGENGFKVPVKDVYALALAMERFIVQPELIEKMGSRSREIAAQKYDVKKVNAVIMKTMGLLNEKDV